MLVDESRKYGYTMELLHNIGLKNMTTAAARKNVSYFYCVNARKVRMIIINFI